MDEMNLDWIPSPDALSLEHDQVHVWRAALNLPAKSIQQLSSYLAKEELARADRFRFSRDRLGFIASRGTLRAILSRYTGISPEQIRFGYHSHGKPFLVAPQTGDMQTLNFNLSHSSDLAIIALARSRDIGVDVERLRSDVAYAHLARRFFTPSEQATLFAFPLSMQVYAFYAIWTCKEAYLKATGSGLSQPLDGFDVDLLTGGVLSVVGQSQSSDRVSLWSLLELTPASGYSAALAVAGRDWELSCWQWV